MAHAHHGGHHEGSADDQYRETPPGAGYEHTDANTRIIAHFLFWLGIAAVVVHLGMWGVFALFVEERREVGEPQFPLAVGVQPEPPAPRLQQFPQSDLRGFRRIEADRLTSVGWVDREAGVVHIPIEEAMRLVVQRGLPSRAASAGENDTLGLRPAGSSSGRTFVGRQEP